MDILSKRGAMFDIATRISRPMAILLCYFNLITATSEKPFSHKYDVANGTKHGELYSLQVEIQQNEMSELGLYMLFRVRTEIRLINFSASRDVNP